MYLFRLSYMYAGMIGFLVVYILGLLFSYILKCTKYYNNDAMYLDESRTLINPDLFLPPIAKVLEKRNQKNLNTPMKHVDHALNNKY
jgi:solute carrier family 5 (sodium-coupled monocarboxylate transporter), member 8/12